MNLKMRLLEEEIPFSGSMLVFRSCKWSYMLSSSYYLQVIPKTWCRPEKKKTTMSMLALGQQHVHVWFIYLHVCLHLYLHSYSYLYLYVLLIEYLYLYCMYIHIYIYVYLQYEYIQIYMFLCLHLYSNLVYIYISWRIHPWNRGCSEFRSKMPSTLYHQSDLFGVFVWESGTSKMLASSDIWNHSPYRFSTSFWSHVFKQ